MARGHADNGEDDEDRALGLLMAAAQDGDKRAYDQLLERCEPIVRRAVRRVGLVDDRLNDVVQDTLLTLHHARQTYDPSRSFKAWVSVIARRRTIDLLRRDGRTSRREVNAPIDYEAAADENGNALRRLEAAGEASELRDAIASLSPLQREAVERLALKEQSLAEASVETGRTIGSLKVNLHRAIKSLRERLGLHKASADLSEEDRHV